MAPIPDANVYRAADRLIRRHGEEALSTASRLIERMVDRKDRDRFLLCLRIRQAIVVLQAPSTGALH
jgi:hypothetical protein